MSLKQVREVKQRKNDPRYRFMKSKFQLLGVESFVLMPAQSTQAGTKPVDEVRAKPLDDLLVSSGEIT